MFCLVANRAENRIADYSYNGIEVTPYNVLLKNDDYIANPFDYDYDFFDCQSHNWYIWDPYEGSYPYFFSWSCVSGTCISGAVVSGTCVYGVETDGYMEGTWVGTDIQPYYGGYHGAVYKPIDEYYESMRFTLDFKIKITQLGGTISFGFLRTHHWGDSNWKRHEYWGGCQIAINKQGRISLVVHDDTNQYSTPEYDEVNGSNGDVSTNNDCYCRLESDGEGNYRARVWYDAWDTGALRRDLTLYSNRRWRANKLGMGGGSGFGTTVCRLYNINLYDSYAFLSRVVRGDAGCEFNGSANSYLSMPYGDYFNLSNNRFNFDFHVNFYELPEVGSPAVIAKAWPDDTYSSNSTLNPSRSWALILNNTGTNYVLEFHACYNNTSYSKILSYTWNPQTNRWYHVNFSRGPVNADRWYNTCFVIDRYIYANASNANFSINNTTTPIIIGKNLNGLISNLRISKSINSISAGGRIYRNTPNNDDPPFITYDWERMYTIQLYVSDNNAYYGHYMDVETYRGDMGLDFYDDYDIFGHYYSSNAAYSSGYYSYFAIDLEQRHKLSLIRSFGSATDRLEFSINSNVEYAVDEVSCPTMINFNDDYDDCRWVIIKLYNGDGTTRVIRKLGIYPDVTECFSNSLNKYNCVWTDLGKSITSFYTQRNLAIGATISGSSAFGTLGYYNIIDGVKEYDFYKVWGSDGETNPWIILDLGAEYQIYRFKVFHGVTKGDTDFMITGYNILYSTDATNYSTAFTITSNLSFERTHDLATPITARWIKFYVTSFNSRNIYIRDEENKYRFFSGAVLRELEVYEYYGFETISSEEYPIVAINLGDQYYLQTEHEIVGIDAESTTYDWSNDPQYFCYSDSVLNDPKKIAFSNWGEDPNYEKWILIQRNTATNYNSGPDYLKHLIVKSIDKQNPCEHPHWWRSYYSTIKSDYSRGGVNSIRSIEIDYPAITQLDIISFIEGDDFGTDAIASWRDGLGFVMDIEGSENIDLNNSYFFLGGYDSTANKNEVVYKWYMSTISGAIDDVSKPLLLRFKLADTVDYTKSSNPADSDTRIVSNLLLKKLGVALKGTGAGPIKMFLDGFKIQRNHFLDGLYEGTGLYLTADDFFTAPLSEFRMSSGALSFWTRLDYNFLGRDNYGVFKNRVLFHFNNVHNDVFGCQISKYGLEFYVGNLNDNLNTLSISGDGFPVDSMFHVGVVFSNNGKNIDNDGSTIRVYLNGQCYAKLTETWEYKDGKSFNFIIGGNGIMANRIGLSGGSADAVIGSLKLYNYCKTDFASDLYATSEDQIDICKASDLIEISKDNVTFYKVGSSELPFKFDLVQDGATVPIFVRSILPHNLTGAESRTAGIIVQWDVGV